jgi:hypothetical protein
MRYGLLKEHEAGLSAADLCLDVSDAKRLKALEEENAKLKKPPPLPGLPGIRSQACSGFGPSLTG